ncbi:unnamed protein product [Cuscuta campestris]|uniref:Uncharacterized protein n=1 Tax=Cuscuta campestris TaxID=132261 RepID=A0A484KH01_9ASTE|nr:unnamed protein product [Cuscuta campestris]
MPHSFTVREYARIPLIVLFLGTLGFIYNSPIPLDQIPNKATQFAHPGQTLRTSSMHTKTPLCSTCKKAHKMNSGSLMECVWEVARWTIFVGISQQT